MHQDPAPAAPRWRTCATGGILAAVLYLAIWVPTHPARPHLPTSDLYTHLTVTRHLARGEGFLTDLTYPLSFAFPFARELPQPLVHRQPGFAVLLTAPYIVGAGYPGRALDRVRWMQIILLGVILSLGAAHLLRRRNHAAVLPWLLLLFFNPLLVFAVDWGMVELVCALLLFVLWLRIRGPVEYLPRGSDGLLAGMLAMLRLDLFWVPVLWWVLQRRLQAPTPGAPTWTGRRLGLVLAAWLLVTGPWAIRNLLVTGQPLFSVQAYAEHVKDSRAWPDYSVYRQLDPQPLLETMTTDPVPVLRKFGRGIKFYYRDLPRLVPLPAVAILIFGTLLYLWKARRSKPGFADNDGTGPMALAVVTTILLTVQYAFFDHSLRHLLVVLPVLIWEIAAWLGMFVPRIIEGPARRFHLPTTPATGIFLTAAVALAVVFLFRCRLPGWESAAKEAVTLAPRTSAQIDALRQAPAGILFVDNAAVPWFIDRPVVWSPADAATRHRICELLGQPDANPKEMP